MPTPGEERGLSCWTRARSRRPSSSDPLFPRPAPWHNPNTGRRLRAGTRARSSCRPIATLTPLGNRTSNTERKRDMQRFQPAGPPVGDPATRSSAKPGPSPMCPPFLGISGTLPPAGGGASQEGRLCAGGTSPGGSRPQGLPGGTYGDRPRIGTWRHAGGYPGCPDPATGPMEMDNCFSEGPARPPSKSHTPRPRPRTPVSVRDVVLPSAVVRAPRASPTGWGCLQSLESHIRSGHLSTVEATPDAAA